MKKQKRLINRLFRKYQDLISYAFFGVCTTLVNVVSYALLAKLGISTVPATVVAWVVAVLFAYITNRKWVFKSKATKRNDIIREIISFFACRLLTGLLDVAIMVIFVDKLEFNDIVIKTISNVAVIVINFIASKLIIFTNPSERPKLPYKQILVRIVMFLCITLAAFLVSEYSPLAIWRKGDPGIDSSVFKYVATEIDDGKMPYLDTFDHKGPLLYIINWVGLKISPWRGVWVLEYTAIWITILFAYFMAKLFVIKKSTAIMIAIFSVTPLLVFYNDNTGNYAQVYAMPFIASSFYVFVKYMLKKTTSIPELILFGIGIGATAMLQANISMVWAVWVVAIVVDVVMRKKIRELPKYVMWAAIGVAIVVVPLLVWIICRGAFNDFIYAYFKFNALYASNNEAASVIAVIPRFLKVPVVLPSIIISLILFIEKKNLMNGAILASILVTVYFMAMSGRPYMHYALVVAPLLVYPFSTLLSNMHSNLKRRSPLRLDPYTAALLIIVIMHISPLWLDSITNTAKNYLDRKSEQHDSLVMEAVDVIKTHTADDDRISVYGNWNIVYLLSGKKSATKYSYQFDPAAIDRNIMDDYLSQLNEAKPKIIVLEPEYLSGGRKEDREMTHFLEKNGYSLIWENWSQNNTLSEKRGARIYELSQ